MLPLSDTLVLDLTQVIAGPTAGQILGDMGADVIKVEPLHGEHFRPQFGGAWVPSMNRNKRGLALDLRTPGGREVLMRLARKADVFMEAFTPGVIDKLGFGWDVVSNENPRLVYASISGYGQTGPYAARAGYDPCIQAEVGMIEATGPMGGEMCRVGTAPIDYSTGLACAGGIAFALLARHKTGKGQRLDLSLFDVGMHLMSHWITNYGLKGEDPVRMGTGNSFIFPLRVFPTKTQGVFIACTNDAFWRTMCTALGRKEWLEDKRFATNEDRVEQPADSRADDRGVLPEAHGAGAAGQADPSRHGLRGGVQGERRDGQPAHQGARLGDRGRLSRHRASEGGSQSDQALRCACRSAAQVAKHRRAHGRDHA